MEEVRVGLETREAHDWLAVWGHLTHDFMHSAFGLSSFQALEVYTVIDILSSNTPTPAMQMLVT